MGRNYKGHAGNSLDHPFEPIEARAARVRFISFHDTAPLTTAHGRSAAIGEQIDQHLTRSDGKDIVMRIVQNLESLFFAIEIDGLNGFDAKGLNNSFDRHGSNN